MFASSLALRRRFLVNWEYMLEPLTLCEPYLWRFNNGVLEGVMNAIVREFCTLEKGF